MADEKEQKHEQVQEQAQERKKEQEEEQGKQQGKQESAELSEQDKGGTSSDLKEAMATLQQRAARTTDEEAASEEDASDKDEEKGKDKDKDKDKDEASLEAVAKTGANTEVVEVVAPVYEAKHDKLGRSYSTGKRKTSVVRVWIKPGGGEVKVNGKALEKYFLREVLSMIVRQPLEVAKCEGMFDVMATAKGGGLSGQAGALRHGLARALYLFDPTYRPVLKKAGFLTRDARIVERKKYGKPKARRSFQFSKR